MKKATEHSLTKLADAAFRQAAKKVIQRAKETGTSLIVWEEGMVKRVDPRTLQKSHKKKKTGK